MARVVKAPPRFQHEEWTTSNLTKFANAEAKHQGAERLVEECRRLDNETRVQQNKTQTDVQKKLQQRLDDIRYWKKELDEKLSAITSEIDSLLSFKSRLEKTLQSIEEPFHIAQQCLANREGRQKIDLVHDDVQKELMKEVDVMDGVQTLLQRTTEEATEQVRLNRKAKYLLEKDLQDKFHAQNIDEYCENLKNNSCDMYFNPATAKIEANSTSADEWQNFSNDNINNAETEIQSSVSLRSHIDAILQQTSNDQGRQVSATNLAFDKRIAECKDVKGKLESHVNRIITQVKDNEENITRLHQSIADKEEPMKLGQTRLSTRSKRPNVELCRDAAQYRLVEEMEELESSLCQLTVRLADTHDSLKGLTRSQLDLEDDIQVKTNSLFIDEVQCMGMRRSINIQRF